MGDGCNANKQHASKRDASEKRALIDNDLLKRRRKNLTARARALYDEALEHGMTGQYSARSETILSRMARLSVEEKQKLTELFDATSLGVQMVLPTKSVNHA